MSSFRRRCGWCFGYLRWWQLNLCKVCREDVRLDRPSPRRHHRSHYYEHSL